MEKKIEIYVLDSSRCGYTPWRLLSMMLLNCWFLNKAEITWANIAYWRWNLLTRLWFPNMYNLLGAQ